VTFPATLPCRTSSSHLQPAPGLSQGDCLPTQSVACVSLSSGQHQERLHPCMPSVPMPLTRILGSVPNLVLFS
jgi:hypothetical protein